MEIEAPCATGPQGLRWYHMFFLAMGIPGTVFTVFGFTLGAVGAVTSIALWTLSAVIGLVQCLLWLRLSAMLGHRDGGLPMFAAEGWKHLAPVVAPMAAVGYWLAWVITPAVMGRISAAFIADRLGWHGAAAWVLGPLRLDADTALGMGLVLALALANLRGTQAISRFAMVSGISLLVPIGLCLIGPFVVHGWSLTGRLASPLALLDSTTRARAVLAWLFSINASAYASEMVIVFAGEYRAPADMRRAVLSVCGFSIAVFVLVPLGLIGMIDTRAFAANPAGAFIAFFARLVPVPFGADAIVAILVANMLIAISAAIADSARGLAVSAQEGLAPALFARTNRHGVPHLAIFAGLALDFALMATNASPVAMIATGTIGYMTATVLALSAFLILHPRADATRTAWWSVAAWILLGFNAVVFVVGVASFPLTGFGGVREATIGIAIVGGSGLLFRLRRKWAANGRAMTENAPAPEL
jgi:hypothetical protein